MGISAAVKNLVVQKDAYIVAITDIELLYRGRSAQRFRDPGFLGIVNPENDAVYLPLKNGRNELMLAVSELTGGWGFICRFDNMEGVH